MVRFVKMLIESQPLWALDVVSVCVEAKVRWGLTLAYVLFIRAFLAKSQVHAVPALAVQLVADFVSFFRLLAGECAGGDDLPAAFISGCRNAWFTPLDLGGVFR